MATTRSIRTAWAIIGCILAACLAYEAPRAAAGTGVGAIVAYAIWASSGCLVGVWLLMGVIAWRVPLDSWLAIIPDLVVAMPGTVFLAHGISAAFLGTRTIAENLGSYPVALDGLLLGTLYYVFAVLGTRERERSRWVMGVRAMCAANWCASSLIVVVVAIHT